MITPTPEQLEALSVSAETLAAVVEQARRADDLDRRVANYKETVLSARTRLAEALGAEPGVSLQGLCERAAEKVGRLQQAEDGYAHLLARHGVLQSVVAKACEGLGNAMPGSRGMGLPELVVEAVGTIQQLRRQVLE